MPAAPPAVIEIAPKPSPVAAPKSGDKSATRAILPQPAPIRAAAPSSQSVVATETNPASAPEPPPPAPPDPRVVEAQDWERTRTTNSVDEINAFIRRHPSGSFTDAARARATQLQQQLQAAAASQAEQADWDSLDKSRRASVQEFLSRHSAGAHDPDARAILADLDRRDAEARIASARVIEPPKPPEFRERETPAVPRDSGDQQAILQALSAYQSAYNSRNVSAVQKVWRGMPKSTADALNQQFRYAREMSFRIAPAGSANISGDTATILCNRNLELTTRDNQKVSSGNERVEVTLSRTPAGWAIRSIAAR